MRTTTLVACLVTTMLAITPTTSRADMVLFNYSWSIDSGPVFTGTNENTGNGLSTGSVAFALAPSGSSSVLAGDTTTIPVGNITTTSSAGGQSGVDTYDSTFSLGLFLEDVASGDSTTLTFTGTLKGELTGSHSELVATFNPFSDGVFLGDRLYNFAFDFNPMLLPAPGTTPAVLTASLFVGALSDAEGQDPIAIPINNPDPIVHDTPEPSTLVLFGLAAPLMCQAYRRRNRRKIAARG